MVAIAIGALLVPLVVVLVRFRSPAWYPSLDRALFEQRVRDVGGAHPPLIGVVARLKGHGLQGNHPGPLTFYALWPIYRLLGSTAWALQVACAVFHLVGIGLSLWLAGRRGGHRLVLAMLMVVGLLIRGLGIDLLLDPWNPYLVLSWWLAFLVAIWSLIDGDLPVAPVVVATGAVCAQNHVEYVPLVGILSAVGVSALAWQLWRADRWFGAWRRVRRVLMWGGASLLLGGLLWLPPIVDEVRRAPGNLGILIDQFSHSGQPSIGLRAGIQALLVHADPIHLLRGTVVGDRTVTGSAAPGLMLLGFLGGSTLLARRLGDHRLVRLHVLVGGTFGLGAATMSRLIGEVWYWLGLWAAVLAALALLAIGMTAITVIRRRRHLLGRHVHRCLAVASAILALTISADATAAAPDAPALSSQLAALAPPTAAALADAPAGRYLVTYTDPINRKSLAYGLVDSLRGAGFDIGMDQEHSASVGAHQVLAAADATGVVHIAVGPDISRWRRVPKAEQVAWVDPRTETERADYKRLHEQLIEELRRIGRADLIGHIDTFLAAVGLDRQVTPEVRETVEELIEIGLPVAVFLRQTPSAPG